MPRKLSVREFRANLSDTLGSVYYTKTPVVIEKNGKPVAVLISPQQWEKLRQVIRDEAWETIERVAERNADKDPDEIYQFVTEIVEEVRQERYEKEQAARQNASSH
jgi:prevent-host-death family protein